MTPWQRLRNWFGPAIPALPDGWAGAPLVLVVGRSGRVKAAAASLPFRTVCAGNGPEALALAAALQPTVIVIDARLPRLGGERLVDELRRRRDLDSTPIVLLTGSLDGDARRALLRRGVQDLLAEPYEVSELSARVARLAEGRRRAEVSMRQEYPLLRAVMDQSPDRIFVKDRQGRYLMINPAGARQIGRSIADVIGKDDRDFLSLKAARKRMEEEKQVMDRGESQTYEEVIPDGNTERIYLVTKAPYLQPGGIAGLVGIFRDVTGLKQAQTEHLRQIVETANDAFIGIDPAGAITEWNRQSQAMFGWSRAEAIGLPLVETLIPPRHR